MVKEHHADLRKRYFEFEFFKTSFPDVDCEQLSDAIYLLQADGLVAVQPADDLPSEIFMLPAAIRKIEEDTLLKKGYTVAKMIKDLIP